MGKIAREAYLLLLPPTTPASWGTSSVFDSSHTFPRRLKPVLVPRSTEDATPGQFAPLQYKEKALRGRPFLAQLTQLVCVWVASSGSTAVSNVECRMDSCLALRPNDPTLLPFMLLDEDFAFVESFLDGDDRSSARL